MKTLITADWKDTEDLVDGFIEVIKKLGGYVYQDPTCEGSDTYGFIVSDKKLKKKDIIDIQINEWGMTKKMIKDDEIDCTPKLL